MVPNDSNNSTKCWNAVRCPKLRVFISRPNTRCKWVSGWEVKSKDGLEELNEMRKQRIIKILKKCYFYFHEKSIYAWGLIATSILLWVSNVHHSLEAVMLLLNTFLSNFKVLLKDRQPELISPAFNIAILADNILFMCNTYMSFIHPAWIQTGRSGLMDVPLYLKLRITTITKNNENMASLWREFAKLLEQHKIETPWYGNNHHLQFHLNWISIHNSKNAHLNWLLINFLN